MKRDLRQKFDDLLNEMEESIREDLRVELNRPKKKPGPAKGSKRKPKTTETPADGSVTPETAPVAVVETPTVVVAPEASTPDAAVVSTPETPAA